MPRLFGRLSAAVARPEVFPVRLPRATFVRPRAGRPPELCRTSGRDGPNEWTFAARVAMCGTPPEVRGMPKLTPPPRLAAPPKLMCGAPKPPPPRKPPPPPKCPPPKPPPWPPPPPPPWPAAHPGCVKAIDVMPIKLNNVNFFIPKDRYSSVSWLGRVRGILRCHVRVAACSLFRVRPPGAAVSDRAYNT